VKGGIFIQSVEVEELRELIKDVLLEVLGSKEPSHSDTTLLNRKEAAEYLGVSLPTLRRYVTSGRLRSKKIAGKVFFAVRDISDALK